MTKQEFEAKQTEMLSSIPEAFRSWLSHKAWEEDHAHGREEVILGLDDLVYEFKKCLEKDKTPKLSHDHRIELGPGEMNVDLILPRGQLIQLQYRLESPSIDVCLPTECGVTNWEGDDMEPAKVVGKLEHVRNAKQLVIDLNPEWVD